MEGKKERLGSSIFNVPWLPSLSMSSLIFYWLMASMSAEAASCEPLYWSNVSSTCCRISSWRARERTSGQQRRARRYVYRSRKWRGLEKEKSKPRVTRIFSYSLLISSFVMVPSSFFIRSSYA